jgi:hypothetical protein
MIKGRFWNMQPKFLNAFEKLILLMENLESQYKWRYMVVGGALTPLYAEARQTQDIDVVLSLEISNYSRNVLVAEFKKHDFQPFTNWDDTFHEWPNIGFFTVLDSSGIIKIDVTHKE